MELLLFTNVKSNIINENGSLNKKVTCLILSTELSNKHREKKETHKDILKLQSVLQSTLSYTLYCAIMYRFSNSSSRRSIQIQQRQTKKLSNLRSAKTDEEVNKNHQFIQHTIHNYLSFNLCPRVWS